MRTAILALALLAGCSSPTRPVYMRPADAAIDGPIDAAPMLRVDDAVLRCDGSHPVCECRRGYDCGRPACAYEVLPAGRVFAPLCDLYGQPQCTFGGPGCFR